MSRRRLLLAALLLVSIAAFFALDLGQYFNLEFFRGKQAAIEEFKRANPLAASFIFFGIYIAVTSLSLPFAAVMSLAVGAIFGLLWGTLIVSFASSIGATLAFLSSRFLFREAVRNRFGNRLRAIDAGLVRGGMIPKVTEGFLALEKGVRSVLIVGKLQEGDLARALTAPGSTGTLLTAE